MPRLTGGQALAKSLYREGVRVVFGLPGVQIYHALDGLYDEPIQFISTRHEQATTYMADGYARASGQVGTAMVVPGPGLLNASAGIGTAYACSSPVLVVSGQIQRHLIGVRRGVLHEVHDQLDCIRPITKWARRVLDPVQVPEAVHEAFYHLRTGRPRPVEIEIPPETLAEEAEMELPEPGIYEPPTPPADLVEKAAEALAQASDPLIWAGGGVISSGASDALLRVAEHLQAPVTTTAEGKGAISDRHYLSLGVLRFRMTGITDPYAERLRKHDVVLAVGTRLATAGLDEGQLVVQIDIDQEEVGRNHANTLGLPGDARKGLEALYQALKRRTAPRPSRRQEMEEVRARRRGPQSRVEPFASFTEAIREALPEDGILIAGMTQMGYYSRVHFPVYQPRTYLTSSYFGNLGFEYPTALGAKVACPDRAVVALVGDGGFMYNVQELSTAVQYGINAVAVVFNDGAYGNVLRDQMVRFRGRVVGARLHNPDFVKLAELFGARGARAQTAEELEKALKEALAADAPTLIEVPVGILPYPY